MQEQGKNKILVVDDEEVIRNILNEILTEAGYNVELASGGQEAIEKIKTKHFTVVITDIRMPDVDGLQVLRETKNINPDIEVVMLTGYSEAENIIQSLRDGAMDYLKKPVNDLGEIILTVRKGFEKYNLVQQNRYLQKKLMEMNTELEKNVEERTYELRLKAEQLRQEQTHLEKTCDELYTTKCYLEQLINASTNCIFSTDLEGNLLSFNNASMETFGYTQDEVIHKNISILINRNKKQHTLVKDILRKSLQKKGWNGEIDGYKKDGTSFPIFLSMNSIIDYDNNIIALLGMIRDITAEKKLREELIGAERLATLGTLASKVGHEILNPLSAIINNTEYLKMVFPKKVKDLNIIIIESERIKQIAQDLLNFGKPRRPRISSIDIKDLIIEVIDFLKNTIGQIKHDKINKRFAKIPNIRADKNQIKQVLINLIINASHAIENQRDGTLTISTQYKKDKDYIEILISDNGHGINANELGKIFDPFYTTKKGTKIKGTGLGLAVAKDIVHKHKGSIEVKSEVNKGTTFSVKLPINPF